VKARVHFIDDPAVASRSLYWSLVDL
jgi:hypothetical protein